MANRQGVFAMARGIPVREDYSSKELRALAGTVKDAAQVRRLLAIAAVLDGSSRAGAAKIGGMDRQTLRDWVIRFNEEGPEGLLNRKSPGAPPKLDEEQKARLAELVERGPIPAVDGVVRWRAVDLVAWVWESYRIVVSDDTIYRALHELGLAYVSARPKARNQDAEAITDFKKTSPPAWTRSVRSSPREPGSRSGSRMKCASDRRTS